MSTLRNELKIVTKGWWVAIVVATVVVIALTLGLVSGAMVLDRSHNVSAPEIILLVPMLLLSAVFFAAWLTVIGYIWGDAKRRKMRHVLWTLVAFFCPYGLGIVLYFVLRTPAPPTCTDCGAIGRAGFSFCAQCGAPLTPFCPKCNRPVERGWNACPHCGIRLAEASPTP